MEISKVVAIINEISALEGAELVDVMMSGLVVEYNSTKYWMGIEDDRLAIRKYKATEKNTVICRIGTFKKSDLDFLN